MSFHSYRINEVYSNAEGTIQFIELSVGAVNGEGFWAGQRITVTQGSTVHTYTFPGNLPDPNLTANTTVLIATQGFSDLGVVAPNFIVPSGFLFTSGGTINFADVDSVTYSALPTDGIHSIDRNGVQQTDSPKNFAGVTGVVPGTPSSSPNMGGPGNDTLQADSGNDAIDGGGGTDTVLYTGPRGNYTLAVTSSGHTAQALTGGDGTDTLTNIEKLQFSDVTVDLTVQAKAASITAANLNSLVELYIAYFNRVPDAEGLGYWIDQYKAGQSLEQIGLSFYNAAIQFSGSTGYSSGMTNADFVELIYANVLGRSGSNAPPQADIDYWANNLASGVDTRGSLINTMLGSAHSFKGDATWGWVADLLDNKVSVGKTFAVDHGLGYVDPNDSITQGMAIADAVTPTGTAAAIALIGISDPPLTPYQSPDSPPPYSYY